MTTVSADSGVVLAPEQAAAYQRDGVIHLKGFLDPEWVGRLQRSIDRVLDGIANGDETRKMVHLWRVDETFRELATHSAGPRLAAGVSGASEVRLLFDHLLVKEPNTPQSATHWHHDLPYWPVRGEHICTIWIPLDRVTLANGAVEYALASHRDPQLYRPALPAELLWGKASILPPTPDVEAHRDRYEIAHFDTEPGDCLIHHPLILHGGPPNVGSDERRRAIAIRYVGEDTRFVGGGAGAPIMGEQPIGSALDDLEHPVVWRATESGGAKSVAPREA